MDAKGDPIGLPRISESLGRLLCFLGELPGTIIGLRFDVLLSDPAALRYESTRGHAGR